MHYNVYIMNTKITHLVVSKLQNMFDRDSCWTIILLSSLDKKSFLHCFIVIVISSLYVMCIIPKH